MRFSENKFVFGALRWVNVVLGVLLANFIVFYIALFAFKLKRSFDGIAGPDLDQVYYRLLRVEYQVFWGCAPILLVTLVAVLFLFYKKSKPPELTEKRIRRFSLIAAFLLISTLVLGTHIYKFVNIHFRMNLYPSPHEFIETSWEYSPLMGSEYTLYGPATVSTAHLKAQEEGGNLVSIESKEELDYLLDTYFVEGPVWIGLYRHNYTNERWLWRDGSPHVFEDWNSALDRYRGMYAFLIMDRDRSKLVIDAGPNGYPGYALFEREVAVP